jgi:hypothetical protein
MALLQYVRDLYRAMTGMTSVINVDLDAYELLQCIAKNSISDSSAMKFGCKPVSVWVDVSGSTSGLFHGSSINVFQGMINNITKYLGSFSPRYYAWSDGLKDYGNDVKAIKLLGGGTDLSVVFKIPGAFSSKYHHIIYTDGEISQYVVDNFVRASNGISVDMIVVILVVTDDRKTLLEHQRSVNMSVVEPLMRLTSHLVVCITGRENVLHVLLKQGCPNVPAASYTDNTKLHELPPFDFGMMTDLAIIPSNVVILEDNTYFNLDILSDIKASAELPADLFQKLMYRSIVPKLNRQAISDILKFVQVQQHKAQLEIDAKALADAQALAEQNAIGSAEITASIASIEPASMTVDDLRNVIMTRIKNKKNSLLKKKKDDVSSPLCGVITALQNLLAAISAYSANTASFTVTGSNRANAAAEFDSIAFINAFQSDECAYLPQIECNIMLTPLCCAILLNYDVDDVAFIKKFTSDEAMQNPFEYGAMLANYVTPGVFSGCAIEGLIATHSGHPLTRQPISESYLPLTHNLEVIKAHMAQFFAGGKNLHHLIFAYIGALSQLCKIEMYASHHDMICSIISTISNGSYRTYADLSQIVTSHGKVSITDAFTISSTQTNACAYFMAHSYMNSKIFVDIAFILSAGRKHLQAQEQLYMHRRALETVNYFRKMFYQLKSHEMHIIDYRFNLDASCMLAFELYTNRDQYISKTLSDAWRYFVQNKSKYSRSVQTFITSDQFNIDCIKCLPPSTSIHDGNIQELMIRKGYTQLPHDICIYCDEKFPYANGTADQVSQHIREKTKGYYIPAHLYTRKILRSMIAKNDDITAHSVLIAVYSYLYTKFGTDDPRINGRTLYTDIVSFIAILIASHT